jgi:hypothetical protein
MCCIRLITYISLAVLDEITSCGNPLVLKKNKAKNKRSTLSHTKATCSYDIWSAALFAMTKYSLVAFVRMVAVVTTKTSAPAMVTTASECWPAAWYHCRRADRTSEAYPEIRSGCLCRTWHGTDTTCTCFHDVCDQVIIAIGQKVNAVLCCDFLKCFDPTVDVSGHVTVSNTTRVNHPAVQQTKIADKLFQAVSQADCVHQQSFGVTIHVHV